MLTCIILCKGFPQGSRRIHARPVVEFQHILHLENGEIIGLDNASLLRRFGQRLVVRFHFFADSKPLLILGQLIVVVDQFLLAMRPHPSFEEAMTAALEDLAQKLG